MNPTCGPQCVLETTIMLQYCQHKKTSVFVAYERSLKYLIFFSHMFFNCHISFIDHRTSSKESNCAMFMQSKTHDSLNWIDSECIKDSVQYPMLPFLVQILWNRKKILSTKISMEKFYADEKLVQSPKYLLYTWIHKFQVIKTNI